MITPSAVMINKRVFEEIGVFDRGLPACEDYDLWLRVAGKYPVGLVDEKLVVKTGGHADQLSSKYWGMDRFRVRALEKSIQALMGMENRIAALRTLVKKSTILAEGSRKRGRFDLADRYCSRISAYLVELEYLDGVYRQNSGIGRGRIRQ